MAPIVKQIDVVQEWSPWMVALIVLGAVTVVSSLALIVAVCACCAKKKQEELPSDEPAKQPEPPSQPVPEPPQEPIEPSAQTAVDPQSQKPVPSMSVTTKMNQAADLQLMSNVNGPSFGAGVQGAGGTRRGVQPSLVLMDQSGAQKGKKTGTSSVQPASARGKSVSVNPSVQTQPSARGKSVSVNPSSVGGGASATAKPGGASSVEPSRTQAPSTVTTTKQSSKQVTSTVESSTTQAPSTVTTTKPSTRGASQAGGKSTSSMRGGGSRGSSINPDLNTSASAAPGTAVNPSDDQRTMQGIESIAKPGGGVVKRSRMVAKVKGKKSMTAAR